MKPFPPLVAERPLAQHCAELVKPAPAASELVPALTRAGERMGRSLGAALAPLLGETPVVRAQPARVTDDLELTATIAPLAANALLSVNKARVLLTVEAGPVLRIVDKAFGGRGEDPAKLPEAFPLSAELMIRRIEDVVSSTLAAALDPLRPPTVEVTGRGPRYEEVAGYEMLDELALLGFELEEAAGKVWSLMLIVRVSELPLLLGGAVGEAARPQHAPRHPADEPFGEMELPVSAVLVDMAMPFSAVAALRPGAVLPVAVARAVPLRIGDSTFAHGTVGALDDRVALRLTRVFQN